VVLQELFMHSIGYFFTMYSKNYPKSRVSKSKVHLQYLGGTNVGEGLNETTFCLKHEKLQKHSRLVKASLTVSIH